MPKSDSITITTSDLERIREALLQQHFNGKVTLTDTGETYTVRDNAGFKVAEIGKSNTITS